MQKFSIENAGATLRGPVDLRLFDMAVQMRNAAVLGGRWPAAGQFKLAEGQEIALQPGDIVMVSDLQKLEDGSQTAEPLQRKGKGKSKGDEADAD